MFCGSVIVLILYAFGGCDHDGGQQEYLLHFASFDKRYEGKTTFHIRSCSVTEIRDFKLRE